MAGLIPLLLRPEALGDRTSVILPPTVKAHSRNYSTGSMPPRAQPSSRSARRQSNPTASSLPALPNSSAGWRKAISEVKRMHISRKHRACAARCNELLSNVDTAGVETTYLIYLRFYAATSLEMCARSLGSASNYRTSLLQQAHTHYGHAAALIQQAEQSMGTLSRRGSLSSPTAPSSLHSSSGSVSSVSSWTSSILCSPSRRSQQPNRPKKKVSFELPHGTAKEADGWSFPISEPLIRPDSPTLGFDDEYFAAAAARQELPPLPQHMPALAPSAPLLLAAPDAPSDVPSSASSSDVSDSESDDDASAPASSAAPPSPSVDRYYGHLSALKMQVRRHIASLGELLDPPSSPSPAPSEAEGEPQAAAEDSTPSSSTASGSSSSSKEEKKLQERAARIERLRREGWKRKRFDARRYEELCDAVMAELNF